jgi:predicted nucleotidyltransferase
LATLTLRDRDAIVTKEGLIFRVFGYSHPSNAYICDVEYAPATIFKSANPKALRRAGRNIFYKYYEDEGWRFVQDRFRQYAVFHEMLRKKVAGVNCCDIAEVRRPEVKLKKLLKAEPTDALLAAMTSVIGVTTRHSGLLQENFGVFGSLLHGFYHPKFSDIDLIIYGGRNVLTLRETLQELYGAHSSMVHNEFETDELVKGKIWRFKNLSPKEYVWHQRRKQIYAVFKDKKSGRAIKTEFESVRDQREISNEYDSETKIVHRGWVKILARVIGDSDASFIPSTYDIEPLQVLKGKREGQESKRIVSYMEEFRMQALKDETIYAEGNLEEVTTRKRSFHQIALTYCPRYYEQALKSTQIRS